MTTFKKIVLVGALALIPVTAWAQSKMSSGCQCGPDCHCESCNCGR